MHQSTVTTRPFFIFHLRLAAATRHIQDDVLPYCTVIILVSMKINGQAPVETVAISHNLCKTKFWSDNQLSLSPYVCTYKIIKSCFSFYYNHWVKCFHNHIWIWHIHLRHRNKETKCHSLEGMRYKTEFSMSA